MPVDYHAWTHRPHEQGGTDTIDVGMVDCFRAYMFDDMSVNTTMIDVEWDEAWENGNTSAFQPRTSAAVVAVQGVDEVKFIDLLLPGRYTFCAGFKFSASFNGNVGIMLQDDDPVQTIPYLVVHGPRTYDFGGVAALQLDGYLLFNYSRVYPLLDPFASGVQLPSRCYFQVGQNSGSAKTISEAFLDIHYEPANIPPAS